MITNNDGTVTCTDCGETYIPNYPKDIFSKRAEIKKCKTCKTEIWNFVNYGEDKPKFKCDDCGARYPSHPFKDPNPPFTETMKCLICDSDKINR